MQHAHLQDIEIFIRHSAKLQEIKIWNLSVDKPDEPKINDFVMLNGERKKLKNAHKVTININEQHFLRLKFMTKVKFSLIEVKRLESCEVDDLVNWLQD